MSSKLLWNNFTIWNLFLFFQEAALRTYHISDDPANYHLAEVTDKGGSPCSPLFPSLLPSPSLSTFPTIQYDNLKGCRWQIYSLCPAERRIGGAQPWPTNLSFGMTMTKILKANIFTAHTSGVARLEIAKKIYPAVGDVTKKFTFPPQYRPFRQEEIGSSALNEVKIGTLPVTVVVSVVEFNSSRVWNININNRN